MSWTFVSEDSQPTTTYFLDNLGTRHESVNQNRFRDSKGKKVQNGGSNCVFLVWEC